MKHPHPIVLVILDGYGYSKETKGNAVDRRYTPFLTSLRHKYPSKLLDASGPAVGLPKGVVGNSEAGHLTIGTGQQIDQPLTTINRMISNNTLKQNTTLKIFFTKAAEKMQRLHIMGIASDGNTHGSFEHIIAYIKIAQHYGIKDIIVHPFLDGRDTLQQKAKTFLTPIQATGVIIGSMHGRFYAMDRDNNHERTDQSYATLTNKHQTVLFDQWQQAIDYFYAASIFDEYILPTLLDQRGIINQQDLILHTNVRPERSTQLLKKLAIDHTIVTAIEYPTIPHTACLIKNPSITNCLKATISSHSLRPLITIAESEKWAHVTYFFDGYQDTPFLNETRIHIPSIKINSYANAPLMSAVAITNAARTALEKNNNPFMLINYANIDMVGHTGNFQATCIAAQHIDAQIKALYETVVTGMQGTLIITGDHGNGENMIDPITENPLSSHTTNQVPLIIAAYQINNIPFLEKVSSLADIASIILNIIDKV